MSQYSKNVKLLSFNIGVVGILINVFHIKASAGWNTYATGDGGRVKEPSCTPSPEIKHLQYSKVKQLLHYQSWLLYRETKKNF